MYKRQLVYSVAKLKEMGIVTSGYAVTHGIGAIDPKRAQESYEFLLRNKMIEDGKLKLAEAYRLDVMKDIKVLP